MLRMKKVFSITTGLIQVLFFLSGIYLVFESMRSFIEGDMANGFVILALGIICAALGNLKNRIFKLGNSSAKIVRIIFKKAESISPKGLTWIIIFLLAFIVYNLLLLNRHVFWPEKHSAIKTRVVPY
jgi:hypothetical protein